MLPIRACHGVAQVGAANSAHLPGSLAGDPGASKCIEPIKPIPSDNCMGYNGAMSSTSQLETLLPELRAYARSISASFDDAEDLVQEGIERALRATGRPDALDDLRPWMFRVMRNLNIDEHRKRRVRMEYSLAQGRLLNEVAEQRDTAEIVLTRIAFSKLPPAMREVLFLVDIMGLKYSEAAIVMDVPHGTVMSRVSRARRSLLAVIGEA
jgi:RNA polymerase sigma-70 factor, ECF subfamily